MQTSTQIEFSEKDFLEFLVFKGYANVQKIEGIHIGTKPKSIKIFFVDERSLEEIGKDEMVLDTKLESLDISVRLLNTLKSINIHTIGEIRPVSLERLKESGTFGRKTEAELNELLSSYGLEPKSKV